MFHVRKNPNKVVFKMLQIMHEQIFLIGCARSGTTILGEFFQNNSQCYYLSEIDVWQKHSELLYKIFRFIWRRIPNPVLIRTIHYKLSKILLTLKISKPSSHLLTENDVTLDMMRRVKNLISDIGNKRLVIKHPRYSLRIPFIKKLFPNAKFLHIVRDGRDVTCSLMGKQGSGYWAHIKPSGWEYWQDNHPKGPIKYAWQWNETIEIINKEKSKLPERDFEEIHYEDLVSDPERVMKKVFEKFGIPFERFQMELSKKVQNSMKNSYIAGTSKYITIDHSKRIGRFKENLTEDELVQVEKILGKNNAKYGYH